MSFDRELADKLKQLLLGSVPAHTGTIVYTSSRDGVRGCASCVYVEFRRRKFAITCAHVTRDANETFVLAIPKSDQPSPFGPVTRRTPAVVLVEDAQSDIAVLDADEVDFHAAGKRAYDFEQSGFLTRELLEKQIGLMAFIWGAHGEKTELTDIEGSHTYVEVPAYGGRGWIKSVTHEWVTSEFREEVVETHNIALFPQLKDMQAHGASRDLSGMSGSGLWVADENVVVLSGILKGPASGIVGDPEMRFVPIWLVREMLNPLV